MNYTITQSRLLYVLSINDRKHRDMLKIGEVFVDNEIADNPDTQVQAKAVRDILDSRSYMNGVKYKLEHVESTTFAQQTKCYKADDIHRTLIKNKIIRESLAKIDKEEADFWFQCTLEKIKEVISQVKEGHGAGYGDIKFRPEQEKAISDTVDYFTKEYKDKDKGKSFLWNAKMRFGKTLCGLEVAKRCDYKSTLIITHRPVVDKGWHDDFKKIFDKKPEYVYATRMSDEDSTGGDFYKLTKDVDAGKKRLVFFVSMQYLRLSKYVGGKERNLDPLKKAIMEYDWDFVMVDEAHEGIEAAAGLRVMEKLKKEKTRILSLSGTPFNLLDKFDESEIYTWDYVMEQRRKQEWDDKHYGDPNPYADLPCMQILTFTLPKMVREEAIENNETFKFHEFFRVWTEEDKVHLQKQIEKETDPANKVRLQTELNKVRIDKFIHEGAIKKFVEKLRTKSDTTLYPFSQKEFRDKFRHTFWLLPGVKEAAALEEILKQDSVFGEGSKLGFHIINAAGDGNIEDKDGSALAEVEDNIRGYDPSKDPDKERARKKRAVTAKERTITLSCGKLTTGVSVPEWTAVLCMKGSENTPAANYMQTIFRVQTHAVLNGRQKSDCYVFDFAPDRALTAVAETAKMAVYARGESGKKLLKLSQAKEEEHLESFLKLCPVLSMDEGEMGKKFSANQIFEKLSNVYIERAVRSGYADNSLYNPEQLLHLTPEQEKALGDVHDLLGSMPNVWKPDKITINDNGLGNTDNVEKIKTIYYLTHENITPARPTTSPTPDENGCPRTDDPIWSDKMNLPDEIYKYLFVAHSKFKDGEWSEFTAPVLWKQYIPVDPNTERARAQREKENKEKRARMSVLRGVSIRIPLLVYGAEINDEDGEEITIDNFASNGENGEKIIVDDASWDEFMPKGFTKKTFNILKDCFDRSIFTGAAKRIRQMVKEADNLNTEDRIAKIATIFSYFHNPDKETVLTPWRVVNLHMSECLGGWCFWNEEFDAENTIENQYGEYIKMPRFVDQGKVTQDIFGDYNARILEINSKTGLYPLYMAYSMFKTSKEKAFREIELTGERGTSTDSEGYYRQAGNDLEIWKDVLQDNIFVVCRTKMAVSITKRTLAGFRNDIRMNVKYYSKDIEVNDLISAGVLKRDAEGMTKQENTFFFNRKSKLDCDMITVLRAKPEAFRKDIVQGVDFWHVYNSIPKSDKEDINNMKFKAIVGNPPYQQNSELSNRNEPIYHLFYDSTLNLSKIVSFITPGRFLFKAGQTPKEWVDKMLSDEHFKVVKYFSKSTDVFPNVDIKGGVTITMRNEDENYGTIGTYTIYDELNSILGKVMNKSKEFISSIVYSKSSYSFTPLMYQDYPHLVGRLTRGNENIIDANIFTRMPELFIEETPTNSGYIGIWGREANRRVKKYISAKYISPAKNFDKYKVFITGANGSGHLGEVLSNPFVAEPGVGHTQTFMSIGTFATEIEAEACLKYLKTKFARCLLGTLKVTQNNNKDVWANVPLESFSAISDIDWTLSIPEIDKLLYKKYELDEEEQTFIETMINPME